MKFSVSREKFIGSLGVAVRGVSTRSAIQTLAGIRLEAEQDGGVELQATDMERGVRRARRRGRTAGAAAARRRALASEGRPVARVPLVRGRRRGCERTVAL